MTFTKIHEYNAFLETNSNFTGVCVILYPNGQKAYERNFVNGKHHGKQHAWHENGQKSYEHNLVDGKQHGKQYGWYPSGRKQYEYNFVNGKRHGKRIEWYENGQKLYEENYVNGFYIGIQFFDGKTYEEKPEENNIWYIIVEEIL